MAQASHCTSVWKSRRWLRRDVEAEVLPSPYIHADIYTVQYDAYLYVIIIHKSIEVRPWRRNHIKHVLSVNTVQYGTHVETMHLQLKKSRFFFVVLQANTPHPFCHISRWCTRSPWGRHVSSLSCIIDIYIPYRFTNVLCLNMQLPILTHLDDLPTVGKDEDLELFTPATQRSLAPSTTSRSQTQILGIRNTRNPESVMSSQLIQPGIYILQNFKSESIMDLSGGDNKSIIGFPRHGLENQQVKWTQACSFLMAEGYLYKIPTTVNMYSVGNWLPRKWMVHPQRTYWSLPINRTGPWGRSPYNSESISCGMGNWTRVRAWRWYL